MLLDMARKNRPLLPPLAFGNHRASVDVTPQAMQDRAERMTRWNTVQDRLGDSPEFEYRAAGATLGDLKLIATSSTPTIMRVDAPKTALIVPLAGSIKTRTDGKTLLYAAEAHALFSPAVWRDSEGGVKSSLIVEFNQERLNQTLGAMLGEADALPKPMDMLALISLRAGNVAFDRVFKSLCQQLDQFEGQDAALAGMGLADSFYRALAIMFNQELLLSSNASAAAGVHGVDRTCEYIRDHVSTGVTLTDLEAVSGLSARALQYGFLKRFNCTPMQWARQCKAHYAHSLLLAANETTTVASVAAQCGFSNFGKFSQFYKSMFNELPVETLKKALGKK